MSAFKSPGIWSSLIEQAEASQKKSGVVRIVAFDDPRDHDDFPGLHAWHWQRCSAK
jgi:hypothetical protein